MSYAWQVVKHIEACFRHHKITGESLLEIRQDEDLLSCGVTTWISVSYQTLGNFAKLIAWNLHQFCAPHA